MGAIMISTVIFDLDGLLADTEKLHCGSYQDVFGELGLTMSDAQYDEHWIRDGKGIDDFISENGLDVDPEIIRPMKASRYDALVRSSVEPMPGALAVLDRLQGQKTLALATASYASSAAAVMETLEIEGYFACIAAKDDVDRVKPFPDIFLFVAEQLGVEPCECVVIEDAEKGILAAAAAGMPSIAVPNVHTQGNDFSKASMVLKSLDELSLETITLASHT